MDVRTRQEEDNGLERVKEQTERLADDPSESDNERNDEERDLLCCACNSQQQFTRHI